MQPPAPTSPHPTTIKQQPPLPEIHYICIRKSDTSHANKRYTQSTLHYTLQTMGCKPRHASKACAKVFLILQQRAALPPSQPYSLLNTLRILRHNIASVTITRPDFERLILEALYSSHGGCEDDNTSSAATATAAAAIIDLQTAMALQERRTSVSILLCGTSGTGKSTLASLLASRLGITTIISTDSVRHLMRSFSDPMHQPILWASTYQASSALDTPNPSSVAGYLAQAEAVMSNVERLIAAAEARRDSFVVEGVHLSPQFATTLMRRHPSVIPFVVHISNEAKHLERFAVRAKAMSLRPEGNRYVRHLRAIREIQDALCTAADDRAVPKVDNTNVDRSVAVIHATVMGCLRRRANGESLIDGDGQEDDTCRALLEEYVQCKNATWSGSQVLEVIRQKTRAGVAPSPPSTSAAASTRGPLSDRTLHQHQHQHQHHQGVGFTRGGSGDVDYVVDEVGEEEESRDDEHRGSGSTGGTDNDDDFTDSEHGEGVPGGDGGGGGGGKSSSKWMGSVLESVDEARSV